MKDKLGYLASPYKNYYAGLDGAYHDVCVIAGNLIQAGVSVYCPIAHGHGIARYSGMEMNNYDIWMPLDKMMLDRCDFLIVAHMLGWTESRGITEEINYFLMSGKPIYDLDIGTLCLVQRK